MGTAVDLIRCPFRSFDSEGKARCLLPDTYLKEHLNGCPSCVDLPPVELLLDQEAKDNRRKYWDEIRKALSEDRATLALGAGISIPMGMPNWLGLISQMAGYAQQLSGRVEPDLVSGRMTLFHGVNVLESGQYIEHALRHTAGKMSVQDLLKNILSTIINQSLSPAQWIEEKWKRDHRLLDDPRIYPLLAAEHNSLCAAAYLLCAGHGFRRALTYNFDTLVQEYLIEIFGVTPNRIFTHPGEWSNFSRKGVLDPIDIFHVHGCIPRSVSSNIPSCAFPKESDQVVLTESSYYNTEQSGAYNWQNSIQSYYLNRDSCVFVGFSADDYNFRRILRQMEKEKHPKHYLILTIDNVAQETWATVCRRRLFSNATTEQIQQKVLCLLKMQLDMKVEYWNRYNFYPIWVTVDDIPRFLLSLL